MAKTYLSVVKYMINIDFEIKGVVDKHDIIGAVFGQSEGLVGEDLNLKELQQNGKIGRIEVNYEHKDGNTIGVLSIPSSMNTTETALLAAMIEAVEKVGPCECSFKTKEIKDVRVSKREQVQARAKELLAKMISEEIPDTKEFVSKVSDDVKIAGAKEREGITFGPGTDKEKEIILVEGRADVLNLLKNGIKNVLSFSGNINWDVLKEMVAGKTVTVFLDGDRGAEINLKHLSSKIKIDNVIRAPDGKEVEELTKKEIVASMKHYQKFEDFRLERKSAFENRDFPRLSYRERNFEDGGNYKPFHAQKRQSNWQEQSLQTKEKDEKFERLKENFKKLKGTMKAILVNKALKKLEEVEIQDLDEALDKRKRIYAVLLDGIITERLMEKAKKKKVEYLLGVQTKVSSSNGIKIKVVRD